MVKASLLVLILTLLSCSNANRWLPLNDEVNLLIISHRNTNAYLLQKEKSLVLIDCGYEGTEYKIEEALSKNGHTGRDIDYLIVTHAHGDHAGAARNLQKMYGCKVIAGERDRFHFENGKNAEICPVSFTAKMMSWFLSSSFPGISPDSTIANGDTLSLAEWPIEIFQMPGHTPGSLIIRCEQSLFVGDLIRGKIGNHQKAVRHYFMCDLEGNDEDIKSLLKAYPNTVWYPGHFGPLTSPENY